ncbi:helicase-related protein [Clostridium sp. UBA4548]|uniref:helicase-related protein n=1 Tax=Clostridium sp. UBA4548 TaxID=1946361 RepID=UPI0025B9E932|nr:helicase-related protein [Clostridium sp. UBA4548]
MKRGVIERNFRKIKNQIHQINEIVKNSKTNSLWEHEASIRKKLKQLKEFEGAGLRDYEEVYQSYLEILEYISERLVNDYNNKNDTKFNFRDIIEDNYEGYLKSGIISVLISNHIPRLISSEFDRVFPMNPKNEYRETRRVKREFYLHLGETNTGKTYNAMQRLKGSSRGIYLSPLRILALENYERLNNEGVKCSLFTGEEEIIVEGATHISCTIEKLDIEEEYQVAIIDEVQMIDDDQRGAAWTRALLGVKSKEVHLCGSLNAKNIIIKILEDCEENYTLKLYQRQIPLQLQQQNFSYRNIEEGDALVVFSKKRVLELAYEFADLGIKASLIYGDLPPEVRRKQYEQFINKETKILICTDAIGMGVNLPIKRIIFMDIKKYDGNEFRFLNSHEVKQIAGRAGRKGIYEVGYVASIGGNQDFLDEMLSSEDREIKEAVVGPSEAILKVKSLSLREKLALWSTREEQVPFYRKMDINEYLIILDHLKSYKLHEQDQWKLIRIPFDVTNPKLMEAFLIYVDQLFIGKMDSISKPSYSLQELYELEIYYQKVNLYYSFSKIFKLEYDEHWVQEERARVSEEINKILLDI